MEPLIPIRLPPRPRRVRDDLGAALARRVGPLLGVFDRQSPLGRSWVVDVAQVATRELSQGYPDYPASPERSADGDTLAYLALRKAVEDRASSDTDERGKEAPLSPTTIGKFGPNTRAALILEAANSLLADIHAALEELLTYEFDKSSQSAPANTAGGPANDEWRVKRILAIWAVAVGEIWAGYPALIWAALWARNTQRSEQLSVRSPFAWTSLPAESEFGYRHPRTWDYAPKDLQIIDGIVDLIRHLGRQPRTSGRPLGFAATRLLRDSGDNLAHVISNISGADGAHPAIVWIPPLPSDDERVTTAYAVPVAVIKEFALRQNFSPVVFTHAWQDPSVNVADGFTDAADALSPMAFALFVRVMEVGAEWASRSEESDRESQVEDRTKPTLSNVNTESAFVSRSKGFISPSEHASIQAALADTTRNYAEQHLARQSASEDTDQAIDNSLSPDLPAPSLETIAAFATLRATACELRRLTKAPESAKDSTALRITTANLLTQLDQLASQLPARLVPTGPGMAQLSRATSDIVEGLKAVATRESVRDDSFWRMVHRRVGAYWATYEALLDESVAPATRNAADHYMGNIAGYLRNTNLAPSQEDVVLPLRRAFALYQKRIIPYRERQLQERAEWAESCIHAVRAGVRCVSHLAEAIGEESPVGQDLMAVYLRQAAEWVVRGANLLPAESSAAIRADLELAAAEVQYWATRYKVAIGLRPDAAQEFAALHSHDENTVENNRPR